MSFAFLVFEGGELHGHYTPAYTLGEKRVESLLPKNKRCRGVSAGCFAAGMSTVTLLSPRNELKHVIICGARGKVP